MRALGMLERATAADLFDPGKTDPVRPGIDAPAHRSAQARPSDLFAAEDEAETMVARVEMRRDHALQLVEVSRTSTTLARLAQLYAVLGDQEGALSAAGESLALSLLESDKPSGIVDTASARIAAGVMFRFGAGAEVRERFAQVASLPKSLLVMRAELAADAGDFVEALAILGDQDGPLIESYRGFLLICTGEPQKAIGHLRHALRQTPEDATAAMNLSVALWTLGSRRKAIAAAVRAVRTAPGRRDLAEHYLEMLLGSGQAEQALGEVRRLLATGVVADAQLDVVEGRCLLGTDQPARALSSLNRALGKARLGGNESLSVEISANIARLRYSLGRASIMQTKSVLLDLLRRHPDHEAVVTSFASMVTNAGPDLPVLRPAVARVEAQTVPNRRAFLRHQVAWLEGDNKTAGEAASDWFELEPDNIYAATAAIVSLGIGLERWNEAIAVSEYALTRFPGQLPIVNNAAYALAMSGQFDRAIEMLEPLAETGFVLKATLGLAYLAKRDIVKGMRLYREAALEAGTDSVALSLMTIYQALVVRQLGLEGIEPADQMSAQALPSVAPPAGCEDHGDFLRLRSLCRSRGYDWPPALL